MGTKARKKTRGDQALEKEMRRKARVEFGLDFKGQKKDHAGPPHLWPNEMANDPSFRRFKGDSKASSIKDTNKRPEKVRAKGR